VEQFDGSGWRGVTVVRLPDKQQQVQAFRDYCRKHDLPFTAQRKAVLETVLDLGNHPAADQVYDIVKDQVHGISRATVYRTLETLVRSGCITKVGHTGRATRYDGWIGQHHHLLCLGCDAILDFEHPDLNQVQVPDTSSKQFQVTDFSVQIRGLCTDCRKAENKETR
jgi:Fe2+ or Zn2+ uptake regulation protein